MTRAGRGHQRPGHPGRRFLAAPSLRFHNGTPMTRHSLRLAALLAFVAAPLSAQQSWSVDTNGVGRIIDQGMNHSQVMDALRVLSDSIGPRLAGSPASRNARDWA